MKPKIETIIEFLESGGQKAIITSPENLLKALQRSRHHRYHRVRLR